MPDPAAAPAGRVVRDGGGPGADDLITVRGRRLGRPLPHLPGHHRAGRAYWDAACDTGRQILLRSGGPSSHAAFTPSTPDGSGISWAFGITGLLSFFRRLAQHGGPDSIRFPARKRARPLAS